MPRAAIVNFRLEPRSHHRDIGFLNIEDVFLARWARSGIVGHNYLVISPLPLENRLDHDTSLEAAPSITCIAQVVESAGVGASVTLVKLASGLATSTSTVSGLLTILIKDRKIEKIDDPGHEAVYRVIDRQEGQVADSGETENQDDIPLSNVSSGGVNVPPPSAPPSMAPLGSGDPERCPSTNQPAGHQFEAEQLDRMVISLPLQQFMVKWDKATAVGATDEDERIVYVRCPDRGGCKAHRPGLC